MLDKVKSDPFEIAKQNLIEPYGLTETNLFNLHNKLEVKGVDFADIYLQSIISESWNLEEGIVKGGAFSIDQGFGVRTVSGDRTSFAFSDTISQKTLREAVKNTLAISRTSTEKKKSIYLEGKKNRPKFGQADSLYDYGNPVDAMSSQEKVELLQKIETLAKKKDPRISQVMASISGSYSIVVILTDKGLITDLRPLVRLSVTAVAEKKTRKEFGVSGGGGRFAMNSFSGPTLESYVNEATRQALINLESRPAPAGIMSVVLGPGWPGILLHEAVGHGLEGDFNRKESSVFSGRIGERVGAPGVTVVDNGTMAKRRGSLNVDDEGNPTQNNILIEDGILRGYMQDRLNSRLMKTNVTGNGRRESFAHLPMPRMTNTYMLNGKYEHEELIKSTRNGVYATQFSGGQVDITSGKFVFSASEAYKIENGKITKPLKGATLIGNGPDILKQVSMVGNNLELDNGIGTCGKDGQMVPVGVGQPSLKINKLTVGGTI